MEDKLNQLLTDADYYSAHQLILSLTKRKVKAGKTEEAIQFVKKGVVQLCNAKQFASAHDAAMSVFEYVKGSNDGYFESLLELLLVLLDSPDAHYWRPFLNELNSKYPECKVNLIDALLNSGKVSGNGDALAATCTLVIQVTSAARLELLTRLASLLTTSNGDIYYILEVSVALIKDGQFADLEVFFKTLLADLKETEELEGGLVCVKAEEWRLVNFCLLLAQLCQRKSPPKTLFSELCNEYLTDDRLRQVVETSLFPVYWPAPKPRGHAGGPPPELMNMLSGLLGSRK